MPVLFMMPIQKGKTEQYKKLLEECTGSRKEEYRTMLKRYDLNSTRIWLQTINGQEYAIFTHDMGDGGADHLEHFPDNKIPFEVWFNDSLCDSYGIKSFADAPKQPEFLAGLEC